MIALALVLAVLIGQEPPPSVLDATGAIIENFYWRLPATIEALRDVRVEVQNFDSEKGVLREDRGVLYIARTGDTPFQINKGERFQMTGMYPESDGCRIQFKEKSHMVGPCPWLDGHSDMQADIFKVISGRNDQSKRK